MQLKNGTINRQTQKVRLPRGFEFVVSALPYGWQTKFFDLYPEPIAPKKVTVSAGGRTNEEYKTEDPGFLREKMQRDLCLAAFRFRVVLQFDENIEWEVSEINSKEDLILLAEEFKNSNLTADELMLLVDAANALAGDYVDEFGKEKDVRELFV